MNILVFDIETIPDLKSGQALYGLSDLSDAEIAEAMFTLRRQETDGSDFLRHHCHQIVAISAVLQRQNQLEVWSLGDIEAKEAEIISRFFQGIEKYIPTLVSWNGAGFDLPVIQYRALYHGIPAPRYWEVGECDQSFKWNNYLNRYHHRHLDLMDVLSNYQARASAPLHQIATQLGLPGKFGLTGADVWACYQRGEISQIRDYCETDALNTYLIFLRFEFIRGNLSSQQYYDHQEKLQLYLENSGKTHFKQFLAEWRKT